LAVTKNTHKKQRFERLYYKAQAQEVAKHILKAIGDPKLSVGTVLADDSARAVAASGVRGGLVVVIGVDDAEALAAYRVNDSYLVHGLDTDAAKVAAARKRLMEKGVYGPVSVDVFDGTSLPYIDSVVNLLVTHDAASGIGDDEIQRVLTPKGVAMARGKKAVKPWADSIGEWTHYMHGPDNNAVINDTVVGPPRHLQWAGPPRWTRDHLTLNSISSVVTSGGRLFFILDEATGQDMSVPGKWVLVARDAFNGVQLWRRPMSSWAYHHLRFRSGPPQLLVASEEHVFVPLGLSLPVLQIDARTVSLNRRFLTQPCLRKARI